MSKKVFANSMEVLSKSSSGKVTAAFPDVCFSPPAPPAGPIPLPYPNSAQDADLDKGSAKVFIGDKMVGMTDNSFLQKSQGDEGATQGQTKGLITQSIQGKAYAVIWSTDVQVEGAGVPRHLDMVTVNHASQMGNGGPMANMSDASMGKHTDKQPVQEANGKLVAIDLKRSKSGNIYHSPNDRDTVTDTDAWQDEDAIQYVNLNGLSSQELEFCNLQADENRCALGRRLHIRVRFSEQKKFSFTFSIKKTNPANYNKWLYTTGEAQLGRIGNMAYTILQNSKKSLQQNLSETLTTDSTGMCTITVDLDSSASQYIITATENNSSGKAINRKRSLTVHARRKLFYNLYLEQKIVDDGKNDDISKIQSQLRGKRSVIKREIINFKYENSANIELQKKIKANAENIYKDLQDKIKLKQYDIEKISGNKKRLSQKNRALINDIKKSQTNIQMEQAQSNLQINNANKIIEKYNEELEIFNEKLRSTENEFNKKISDIESSVLQQEYTPQSTIATFKTTTQSYMECGIELVQLQLYYFNRDEYTNGNPFPQDDTTYDLDGFSQDQDQEYSDFKQIITSRIGTEERRFLVDILLLALMNPYFIRASPASFTYPAPDILILSNGVYISNSALLADSEPQRLPMCGVNYALKRSRLVEGKIFLVIHDSAKQPVDSFEFTLNDSHIVAMKDGYIFSLQIPATELLAGSVNGVPAGGDIAITQIQYTFRLRGTLLGRSYGTRRTFRTPQNQITRIEEKQFRGIITWAYTYKNDIPQAGSATDVASTVSHELAHNLGMVPHGYAALDRSPTCYTGHGNDGDHCWNGLTPTERARSDYRGLNTGNCLMFGEGTSVTFCENCKTALFKTNCDIKFELTL